MKRIVIYGLLILFLGGCATLWAAGTWLLESPDGVRWLLRQVSERTPVKIDAKAVTGGLGQALRMEEVTVKWPLWQVDLRELRLRCRPTGLLAGQMIIPELTLRGVRIQDNEPDTGQPPDLTWPRLAGAPPWFRIRVDRLQLDGLTYRWRQTPPVRLGSFTAALDWQRATLTAHDLSLTLPEGRVTGMATAGFASPSLSATLTLMPAHPLAGCDRVDFRTKLVAGKAPEQLAGTVSLTTFTGDKKTLELTGSLGMAQHSFSLKGVDISRPGQRGSIRGDGIIQLTTAKPRIDMSLRLNGVDLARDSGIAALLSGTVAVAGTIDQYAGRFDLSATGKEWRSARLSGNYTGAAGGLILSGLKGDLLDGMAEGDLRLTWTDGFSVAGSLRAQRLNPARIDPTWLGVVNLDLRGNVQWPDHGPQRSEVVARFRNSRLRAFPLSGELAARSGAGNLYLERLLLVGKGFDIRARGDLARQVNVTADITDLSALVPGAGGRLDLVGWLRHGSGRTAGAVTGHGREVTVDKVRINAAEVSARFDSAPGSPVTATARMTGVTRDHLHADTAALDIHGTTQRHTLKLNLTTAGAQVATILFGGYDRKSWQGEIMALTGSDRNGPWNLASPARLKVSAAALLVSPLRLAGNGSEHLELATQLSFAPLRGVLRAEWRNLNLNRADHWLKDIKLAGASSGALRVESPAGTGMNLASRVSVSGVTITAGRVASVRQADLDIMAQGFTFSPDSSVSVTTRLSGVSWDHLHADSVALDLRGSLTRHTLKAGLTTTGAELATSVSGGYRQDAWQGEITTLAGKDRLGSWKLAAPARMVVSPGTFTLSPARIMGDGAKQVEVQSRLFFAPLRGELKAAWNSLDLSRANQWLTDITVTGKCSGTLSLDSPAGTRMNLTSGVSAAGTVTVGNRTVTVRRLHLDLKADERGILSTLDLGTADGIGLHGRFTSADPARPHLPERGELTASWEGIDLALLKQQLPPDTTLSGSLGGNVTGKLLPGQQFDLAGTATLKGGAAQWRGQGRQVSVKVAQGELAWAWRGASLSGTTSLTLAEHGTATAEFSVPLPARFGAALNREGPVRGTVQGRGHEKGLLTALFPGVLRESRGDVAFDLQVDGIWRAPRFAGRLELSGGGGYLPSAGVTLKDMGFVARLAGDRITMERVTMTSGPGTLTGTAMVQLTGFRPSGYQGTLRGEKFQVVRLPDLQTLVSPDLTFDGAPDKLTVRGTVKIPELTATGSDRASVVQPSPDVIVERSGAPPVRPSRLALDMRINVALGERVFVKMEGLDGKLEGNVALVARGLKNITGTGEIKVAKGRFSTYGVNLDIQRGRAIFTGGPVERPTLDILALREIGDVKAGVTVRGTPVAPVVRLYSSPAMPDVEILSYIVLGRKLNAGDEKNSLLMNAASMLATTGESVYLQEQLKQYTGLDTFEVTSAKQKTSGYTKMETGLLNSTASTSTTGVADSLLQVGKYLTPQLYVSYGWSLFSDSHVFKIRYNLTKQWEIETRAGTSATGGDIFYRIEFE